MKFYPPGPVTRYGIQLLKEGMEPLIIYTSGDGSIQWAINGGLAPYPNVQEGAFLQDGVAGFHPSFSFVEAKGARQAGVTTQATVYDPAEFDLPMEFTVPADSSDPVAAGKAIARVIRDWISSWDPDEPGKLEVITPDMGRWWCHPRLFRSPPERQFRAQARRLRQSYTWTARNDAAFWRSTDSVSEFKFKFSFASDNFRREDETGLGPQWAQTYDPADGGGTCGTDGKYARWFPEGNEDREVRNRFLGVNEVQTVEIDGEFDGGTWTYTVNGQTTSGMAPDIDAEGFQQAIEALSGVSEGDVLVEGAAGGPFKVTFLNNLGFQNITTSASGASLTPDGTASSVKVATAVEGTSAETETDMQVVTLKIGEAFQWPFPELGALDIWCRLNDDDEDPTGVRFRIFRHWVTLSRFEEGVETVILQRPLLFPPLWFEDWTVVAGVNGNARRFKLFRGKSNFLVLDWIDRNEVTPMGEGYRGSAWGMKVCPSPLLGLQWVPPSVEEFSVGVNATQTQSGHVYLTNFGDQKGYHRFLAYGPGTFRLGNVGTNNYIEFGPLLDGQIALLPTHPRLRGVVDLTPDQPEQELTIFQDFVKRLINLAVSNNTPPLLEWFESLLGIRPPQGELYHLLKGRFTGHIPPKPAGDAPTTVKIPVEIVDGNADSKIIAALTPLRRWPL